MLSIFARDLVLGKEVDITPFLSGATFSFDEHGCLALRAELLLPLDSALYWLFMAGARIDIVIKTVVGQRIWCGRMDQPSIASSGVLTILAWGGWQSLYDIPHTTLFSDAGFARWNAITLADIASAKAEVFASDKFNRLYSAPRKGETVNTSTRWIWGYQIPSASSAQLVALEFNYDFLSGGGGWRFQVERRDSTWGSPNIIATILLSGAAFVSYTFTASDSLTISHFTNVAAPGAAYAKDTGVDDRLILTNLRVKSTTAATVKGSAIVAAVLSAVRLVNPNQLSASTVLITPTTDDIEQALYEDTFSGDILKAVGGQDISGGANASMGVDEARRLWFKPRGTDAVNFYATIAEIEVQADVTQVMNGAYAVYRDDRGTRKRTATVTSKASVTAYGLTRMGVVSAETTTSATTAASARDAALVVNDDATGRVRIEIAEIVNRLGGVVYPWELRPGDTITITNLSAFVPASLAVLVIGLIECRFDGTFTIEVSNRFTGIEVLAELAMGGQTKKLLPPTATILLENPI